MIKKIALACSLIAGAALAVASPAEAWTAVGPNGGVAHGGGYHGHYGWGRGCCYGGGAVAAGVAAGAVVGAAAASARPVYYPAPVYVPPHYVYAPGYYVR